ncbi:MAG: hypothetical protein C0459_10305 [Chitinophaga sp.]|jgi:ribosomal protein L11 methylase PrmA|nr:hypothetical protein [Chitinophaga sp.]
MNRQAISYKDPDAFVIKYNDIYYRILKNRYASTYNCLMKSGLYDELVEQNLIVEHQEVDSTFSDFGEDVYKVLLPEQILFINYPYEWSFTQRKDCIISFLKINIIALKYGMILKDASSFNHVFVGTNCKLIDTSSFVIYNEGNSWLAYKQFCEEMLAPFLLMKYKGHEWSKLHRALFTGMPLKFVSNQLPYKSYFNFLAFWHIHLHSLFLNKKITNEKELKENKISKSKIEQGFRLLLQKIIKISDNNRGSSFWLSYYDEKIESKDYLLLKERSIKQWLSNIQPKKVIDLGANKGRFSAIASNYSEDVISVEMDEYCVNSFYQFCKQNSLKKITHVVIDIVHPSPGLGWENKEKIPMLDRLKANTVLALALIHHLRISNNIPLQLIADLLNRLTEKYLIIEFIPKSDIKIKQMLLIKEDIYEDYTEDNFKKIFSEQFNFLEETVLLPLERKLFLCQKKL